MNEMLLVVVLAGRRAVLPAVQVNSVIELTEATPVPRAAAHVVGLAALRSRPLTLIDCALSLGAGHEGVDLRRSRAVVVEHEGHLYGLLVDAADDIVAALAEPDSLGADLGPGWSRVTTGRVETEAGALPFLDIAALVAGPDQSLAA